MEGITKASSQGIYHTAPIIHLSSYYNVPVTVPIIYSVHSFVIGVYWQLLPYVYFTIYP